MSTSSTPSRRHGFGRVLLVAAAIGLLAIGCGKSDQNAGGGGDTTPAAGPGGPAVTQPDSADVKTGGRLVYGIEAESDGLDPTKGRWAISGLLVANAIYDEMYAYDSTGVARPYAIESGVPSDNFKTWTMKLRPGMTFHDGTPVNSAAMKKQIEAFKNSQLTGPALRLYVSTDIIDDLTAAVHMSAPWAQFPNVLTGQGGAIVAPATFDNPNGGRQPVGSGPFRFKEWVTDDHLSVVRNEHYWMKDKQGRQLPYLSEVVFKPLPDTQAREHAFSSGDVNMLHDDHPVELKHLKELADEGRAQYVPDTGEKEETFAMFNTQQPPLDDPLLRKALALATDVDQYIQVTENTPDAAADGAFEKTSKWYHDSHFPTNVAAINSSQADKDALDNKNLDEAYKLIGQYKAKHGDGPINIKLTTTTTPENGAIVQMLSQQWARIGVTAAPDAVEQIQIITMAVSGKYDALLWRQFGAQDPDGDWHFFTPQNASDPGQFALNFSRIKDPELDKNLDIGRQTDDFATRKAAYDKVQDRWADLVPYIWLDHVQWVIVADNNVRGIGNNDFPDGTKAQPFLTGSHRLTTTWLTN